MKSHALILISQIVFCAVLATAAEPSRDTSRGDKMIAAYFKGETDKLTKRCLADIKTLKDWKERRHQYHQQMLEMLGLDPMPKKTDLKPVVTGATEHDEFVVENVHFQSRPGLYVTGNFYRPKQHSGPLPTILYVCGHGRVKKNGISYGNKTHYQHHGAWFARNGYACLTIDTLQLGEIEGIHHGTYNHGMFWWNARGYSSAAVEAWNCIRALDYLETREEVDAQRFGVTGRSGGGAYSWWIACLDERIKVAVPVAGITSLQNHVVDGCVEGHCDCMYMVNTYRWDFAQVAALVAPRPLLISNTDKDRIFPLDGVVDVYAKTRRIYELYGELDQIGLQITEGPHKDTQELRIHAFHWFNKFLKHEDPLIETAATKMFQPEQLRVFKQLPSDEKNTTIQESFTKLAEPATVAKTADDWSTMKNKWITALDSRSFRGWPDSSSGLDVKSVFTAENEGIEFSAYDFTSQENIKLRVYLAHRSGLAIKDLDLVVLNVLDEQDWDEFVAMMQVGFAEQLNGEHFPKANADDFTSNAKMFKAFKWGMAYVAPRGIGPTAWDQSTRKQTQHRRRFNLLGQTQDGMRVWDVRRAVQALRTLEGIEQTQLWIQAEREMAGIALYASLYEPNITRLDLHYMPKSHREGPIFLNVQRFLDIPQAVAMAAQKSKVRIYQDGTDGWSYPKETASALGWDKKIIQVRDMSPKVEK